MFIISILLLFVGCDANYDPTTKTLRITNIHSINKGIIGPYPDAKHIIFQGTQGTIEDSLFKGNRNIQSITISGNQWSIHSSAFRGSSIQTFSISGIQSTIYDNTFNNCDLLKQVNIVGNQATIKYNAFKDCHQLSSVIITSDQLKINDYAFCNCENLASNVKIVGNQQIISRKAYDCGLSFLDNEYLMYGIAAAVVIIIVIAITVCCVVKKNKKKNALNSSSTVQFNLLDGQTNLNY